MIELDLCKMDGQLDGMVSSTGWSAQLDGQLNWMSRLAGQLDGQISQPKDWVSPKNSLRLV